MIKRVLYWLNQPLDERNYSRFGIGIVEQSGYQVEVWDFSPFLCPTMYRRGEIVDQSDQRRARKFMCLEEALSAITNLDETCFVVLLIDSDFHGPSYHLYRSLSRKNLRYCPVIANPEPIYKPPNDLVRSLSRNLRRLRRLTPSKIVRYGYYRVPFRLLGIRPATALLVATDAYCEWDYPTDGNTEIIWGHHFDYDVFLKEANVPCNVDKKLGVFLDQNLPYCPEYGGDVPNPFDPEGYFSKLRSFFDVIERRYGVHIVIAAHPSAEYSRLNQLFGNRVIVEGQTASLVKQAGFCIAHHSLAVNFAVLFEKPVLFATMSDFENTEGFHQEYVELMAELLGKKPVDTSLPAATNMDWEKEMTFNKLAYAQYRERYIKKSGTDEKPCWQKFVEYLQKHDSRVSAVGNR